MKMRHYNFPIVVEQDNDGFFVSCPELQGCYSQGATYEEAVANIKDAIRLQLEDRRVGREKIPSMKSVSISLVDVIA